MKTIKQYLLATCIVAALPFSNVLGQQSTANNSKKSTGKEKTPIHFGLQFKPILPMSFMGTSKLDYTVDYFNTKVSQRSGYSLGGVIRFDLTKTIAIETGISTSQRRYRIESSIPDSNLYVDQNIRFVTYEIPVSALFFIRLGEQMYMNASIGAGLAYNPSLARIRYIEPNTNHDFIHTTLAKKVQFDIGATLGFEYRTKRSGMFYVGGVVRIPVQPLFLLKSEYQYQGIRLENDPAVQGRVTGSYLAFELKYYLPSTTRSKTPAVPKGPIEF